MSSPYSGSALVFGELPSWFELKVLTNLENAHSLFEHLKQVEKKLLTEYISFIMAKAGYSNITLLDMYPFIEDEPKETKDFTIDDWIKHIDAFDCWEELRHVESDAMYEMIERHNAEWSVLFESDTGKRIIVSIVSHHPSWFYVTLRDVGKSTSVFKHFINNLNKEYLNYVVAHSIVYEQNKTKYTQFGEKVSEKLGYQAFFSLEGLLHLTISDNVRKKL